MLYSSIIVILTSMVTFYIRMKTTQTASKLFHRYDTYVWKFVCVCELVTRSVLCSSSESCVCYLRWYRAGLDDNDEGNAFLAIGRAWGIYWVSILYAALFYTDAHIRMQSFVSVFVEENSALDGWVVFDDVRRKLWARAYIKRAQPKFIHTRHLLYVYI